MHLYFSKNQTQKKSQSLLCEAFKKYGMQKGVRLLCEEKFVLRKGKHGKPYIEPTHEMGESIEFSISHSGLYWVCLIAKSAVGVDIERKKNISEARFIKIAQRFFSEEEQTYVKQYGKEGFYHIWVRKEAFIKCKGTGLSENLKSFSVVNEEGDLKRQVNGLWMQELFLPVEVYGAYCCESEIGKIETRVEL